MRVLIAGSRYATDGMNEYAVYCVSLARQREYSIIVGDNPKGIDYTVYRFARKLSVPFLMVGVFARPRIESCDLKSYRALAWLINDPVKRWQKRDEWMCEQADRGVFIWNGSSPGTKAGFEYMKSSGKTAVLVNSAGKIIERQN